VKAARKVAVIRNGKKLVFKVPGDSSYPVNEFSLTVTKTGEDVGLESLDTIGKFIVDHCLKGGVSTEVGQRAFNLHLQGVFRIHWPKLKEYVQHLQKLLKSSMPNKGTKYKVLLKAFAANQQFSAMVGYITKDQGLFLFLFNFHWFCSLDYYCFRSGALPDSHAQSDSS
jgi:hypothetical protein